jgi:predicted lipoprotein
LLLTGLIFGNSVRDATGLLDVSKFPNSQQFNAISSELNALVESRVIPGVRSNAAPGHVLRFVGCAEIADEVSDVVPLKVVPLKVVFLPHDVEGSEEHEGGQR